MLSPTFSRSVLAFDIGGTSTKLALVDEAGDVTNWTSFPTHPPRELFLARLLESLHQLVRGSEIMAVTGALAGFLAAPGTLTYNPNLPWLEGFDFHAALAPHLPAPLYLENDANAAAAGEFLFGSGRGSRRFLCLTGGTGIGVGMVADGHLLRPSMGGLGDAGHLIVLRDGPLCPCGGHGCAEALLSTSALAQQQAERTGHRHSFRNLVDATAAHDPSALATVQAAGHHLGVLLASLTHLFFPDRISIAGGLSALGQPLLQATRASFAAHVGHVPGGNVGITLAHTGAHASLQGAAACFFLFRPSAASNPALTAPEHAITT